MFFSSVSSFSLSWFPSLVCLWGSIISFISVEVIFNRSDSLSLAISVFVTVGFSILLDFIPRELWDELLLRDVNDLPRLVPTWLVSELLSINWLEYISLFILLTG